MNIREVLSKLPSVDEVLGNKNIKEILKEYPRNLVLEGIRETIDLNRKYILNKKDDLSNIEINIENIVNDTINRVRLKYELSLKKVINGTGVVIHTNLGRSLLSESIKDDILSTAFRYSNLEYDIEKGERGSRYSHLKETIKKLTNAEDVLIVNNNAAAVLLVLSTLAKGKEVIVSRGELVEVGGSFRIPSIMELSGAKLVEVGATNKTHLKDYEYGITEDTSVLMKVHTSNYKILGFTESVDISDLKKLGMKYNLPVVEDLGSGVFIDLSKYGLSYEPTVIDSLRKGADIVTFSGDKMLGGPQAGIIIGKKEYIEKMKKNQLTRALRVDKLTICALEATLRLYLDEQKAIKEIPTLKMLTYSLCDLEEKASSLYLKIIEKNINAKVSIEDGLSQVGGGSMPLETIKSKVIAIVPNNINVSTLEKRLRLSSSHIIGRVYDNKYILDSRTIFEDEFDIIANELKNALN